MHRDLKAGNIMLDIEKRKLRVIDWGLADFYKPNKEYSLSVGTKQYKSPELLIGLTTYDYSHDVWTIGCLFGGMLF